MTIHTPGSLVAVAAALALSLSAVSAAAQTAPAHKPARVKPAAKGKKAPAKPTVPAFVAPEADEAQVAVAGKVYYGHYECEFKETVDIVASPTYPSYVDVKHDKAVYLMKPVLSSTGAVRLEDVRGETLMVQISSKSMLLNVKTGHRLVDECVSARQRELMEEARAAKAADAASAASAAAGAGSAASAAAAPSALLSGSAASAPEAGASAAK